MGRPKKPKTEVIFVRLPQELAERLRAEAETNARSISGHVRYLLENYPKP